ncbi:MAG TPA: ABC transporter permease, partial [Candidatus Saccharibacteria bacterium]|nr:ABC transporter permease [Candidatus Saccharibacteria bacterium]
RLAAELGLAVGDTVDLGDGPAEVVGLGVGPDANGDGLGMAVLVSSDRLASAGVRQQFRELLVSVAPGVRVEDFGAELAERYELQWREPPAEVRDLAELGRLPELLGAFLAVLGVLALTHALLLTARRRSGDLAVLQALGSTPTQAALAVVAMAVVVQRNLVVVQLVQHDLVVAQLNLLQLVLHRRQLSLHRRQLSLHSRQLSLHSRQLNPHKQQSLNRLQPKVKFLVTPIMVHVTETKPQQALCCQTVEKKGAMAESP